jgi:EF hand domain-containing protein
MSVGSVGTSSAYSYLQSLLQQQQSTSGSSASDPVTQLLSAFYPSGTGQSASASGTASSTAADSNGCAGGFSFSPDTMASLISIQGEWHQSIDAQAQQVFSEFDTNSDGSISKSEFESGFGSNADMSKVDGLFNALDTNGDGSISLDELTSAAEQGHAHHHHMHGAGQGSGGLADLLSSTDLTGATSQTATNADGSTSTTITYADGSTVTMTTPASSSSDSSSSNSNGNSGSNPSGSSSSNNLLERLIQMQAQLLASMANQISTSA